MVLPKAEKLLKVSIQPYISSILDALMEPTSRGFSEVRDLFFRELVDLSKNAINEGTREMVAQVGKQEAGSRSQMLWCKLPLCPQHMEKVCTLAFHPLKMQGCYQKVEQLSLEGLQQRFDVSSPSVFIQRAQILMKEVRLGLVLSVAMATAINKPRWFTLIINSCSTSERRRR